MLALSNRCIYLVVLGLGVMASSLFSNLLKYGSILTLCSSSIPLVVWLVVSHRLRWLFLTYTCQCDLHRFVHWLLPADLCKSKQCWGKSCTDSDSHFWQHTVILQPVVLMWPLSKCAYTTLSHKDENNNSQSNRKRFISEIATQFLSNSSSC